ncbi:iron uptake transporter permease EfeU [Candidatus Aquiluna sp. UB-MaderosW2red]|uniref:iron uptake transporter permease EfeU n=1 Tax=Candidatus Aquiluna sp. UB-MaderosW2red TaxID=1855377 RepID=UPI000875CEC2|nr:iron uptake transporter permease EfeU [Candidatus Aquiluna sp. UB-MaderosW2red]SCX07988.1 high-affinity iron transporter [Candidatus Aquiluna sp. UB-MaderosW2red]
MISNFLIGLREGLEAVLIISILVAYLVKTRRTDKLIYVWLGSGLAVLLSLSFGWLLTFTQFGLLATSRDQEIFAGAMAFTAVALVTWMIIWMRNIGSRISQELQGKLEEAITGGVVAIGAMAFVAVAREGLETALFFFSAVQAAGSTATPVGSFVFGILTAVLLGYLLYRRAVKINLKKFFNLTGSFLIFVAAGVLLYGVHEWQESGLLPGEGFLAFNLSSLIPDDSLIASLAKGIFNFQPETSWLAACSWLLYVGITLSLFLFRKPKSQAHALSSGETRVAAR